MSKLQNNFTTPEQSKRLLELGVPVDSANCYYTWKLDHTAKINVLDNETYSELLDHTSQITVPCWSVGRLIEIMKICAKPKEQAIMSEELLYCRDLVGMLVFILEGNRSVMDFSKLEE